MTTGSPAGADPPAPLTGVGSDTTQDIINAFGGVGLGSPPPLTVAANAVIESWNALDLQSPPQTGSCIATKPGFGSFARPNGSSNGRRALSRAIDSTPWIVTGSSCPTPSVSGQIDFARSSAGPATVGGPLMYIPLGRDALSFAYYANGVATPVTTLTSAQLVSLFTTGPQTINGVNVIPCSIQSGSGTYQSWNTSLGVNATQMSAATTTCRTAPGVTPPGELQENDGNALKARGDLFPGSQVIIGFSAANFIAQSNNVVPSQLPAGGVVDLGAIDALGKPYNGTPPTLTPNAAFYANTQYGRTVYNVFQATRITGPGNNGLKQMFAQTSAFGVPATCQSAGLARTSQYGFGTLPIGPGAGNCGDTSLRGPLLTGNGSL